MPNYKKRLEKWITVLESGKFEQAQGDLCTYSKEVKKKHPDDYHDLPFEGKNVGYCCLGVAKEIFELEDTCDDLTFANHTYPGIAEFFNLDSEDEAKLIHLNDGLNYADKPIKGKSFKQIARWIEKNLIPKAKTK